MEFQKRKLITELVICLGLLKDKKRVYNYRDVLKFLNSHIPDERDRYFYDRLIHIITGRNNQDVINKTILILLIGNKIKNELYFIFSKVFQFREEEFFRTVIPILQTFSRNLQIYGGKSLSKIIEDNGNLIIHNDEITHNNIILSERMFFEENDYQSINQYRKVGQFMFDLSEYISFPFNSYNKLISWIKSPYTDNLNELNDWSYFRSGVLLEFLRYYFDQIFLDIGGSTKYSYYHLSYIKNRLTELKYSYSKKFETEDEIDSIFLILFFKKDLKLLFELHHENRMVSYTDLLEILFLDDHQTLLSVLKSWDYPISNFRFSGILRLDPENFPVILLPENIEIVSKREFFMRFWNLDEI